MPFALPGIFHLFADRDPVSLRNELAKVSGGRPRRHAGQGNTVSARRERDVQCPGGGVGVLREHFIEVAHAKEEDRP